MSMVTFVYLAGIVAGLKGALSASAFFLFGAVAMGGFWCILEGQLATYSKYLKTGFIVAAISGFVSVLIPSEKTMWLMAGTVAVTNVVESKIGQDMIKLIELKVQEELNEAIAKGKK